MSLQSAGHKKQERKPTNLISVSAGFGLFYWIMEAVRDVVVFEKENILERIFFPDLMALWMRLLAVCILVGFGTYAHTLQKRMQEDSADKPANFFQANKIYFIGLLFALIYWILESIRDSYVFGKGGFFEMLLAPDQTSFWMRLLAIFIITLLTIYVHNLANERKLFRLDLNETKIRLAKEFENKYTEVESTKDEMTRDLEKHYAQMQELLLHNKVLQARCFCSRMIMKQLPVEMFLNDICKMIIDLELFGLVYISHVKSKKPLHLKPVAKSTKDKKYLDILEYVPEEYEIANWPLAKAVYSREPVVVEELLGGPHSSYWSTRVVQKGFKSLYVFPIITHDKVFGILALFPIHEMTPSKIIYNELEQLAQELGYALKNTHHFETGQ